MVTLRQSLAIVLCLLSVPHFTFAFLRRSQRSGLQKRFGEIPGAQKEENRSKVFFKGKAFPPETVAAHHGSIVLECEVGGRPSPTIHWLKNGERIVQGSSHNTRDDEASYEDHYKQGGKKVLRLTSTRSRLYLDCLTKDDEGEYTCVGEAPKIRQTQSTYLRVEKPESILYSEIRQCNVGKGEPAIIFMWTKSRLEFEDSKVQLFCRAEGSPAPTITWYDRQNKPIVDDENYRIAKNGDLIIREVTWLGNMGTYTCVAENGFGTDTAEAFLYPTPREDNFGFPL